MQGDTHARSPGADPHSLVMGSQVYTAPAPHAESSVHGTGGMAGAVHLLVCGLQYLPGYGFSVRCRLVSVKGSVWNTTHSV